MINKDLALPSGGVATFHRVQEIRSVQPFTHTNVEISCYASEDMFLSSSMPMWTTRAVIFGLEVAGTLLDSVEQWLITSDESQFKGGSLSEDNTRTLESEKARAWVRIKATREALLAGNFTYNGDVYQINKVDVNGAFSGASYCLANDLPYTTDWTLADDTKRSLDAKGVVGMGLTLLKFVDDTHAIARGLRELIAAATTIEEVSAITWASFPPADVPPAEGEPVAPPTLSA